MNARGELQELRSEIEDCTRCRLSENRRHAVPHDGDGDADVAFVGKMVGYQDDQVGLPYQGEAGKQLDDALDAVGLTREEVFLTNLTRCYPPDSRDPRSDELDRCADYFERELQLVEPDILVALGKLAAERLLGREVEVEEEHGEVYAYSTLTYSCDLLVTYNVGAAMYDDSLRGVIAEDLERAL